ncbi:REF/SRPP-like protein [Pyrus ussuriensis x Pyrus communis]|uniref:REF/SRPP-like protein n=1 Tax=Pyrus ussuriensis x Pyrus communis TaxID=2448454 RepID=A0A5N5I8Y3_9ROSA|nr:REF/SRPP-like protein [Pyrus ussuriensis x Pyrus communis]
MATVDDGVEINSKEKELKHLRLLRVAAIQTLVFVSSLYDYAKQNSGPLRSTVGTVEGAVTAVIGPVYRKFKGVPDDVLAFLDTKVDEATELQTSSISMLHLWLSRLRTKRIV